jgi:ubiquinone/menaquinone biosynthesis C-methylase UbiE
MMTGSRDPEPSAVRSTAVEHHHADAGRFMRWYSEMAQSRFANAFAYGRHKVDVLLDAALKELPAGARILDVGCGTGEYVRRANELGFQASGLEPAEAMREAAIEKNPGSTIVDGLATQIPFGDESFDLVICIEVLRYLHRADVDQALGEMRRVLKPGGKMFLTMVNRYALDGFFIAYHARKLLAGGISTAAPHCEFVTPAEVDKQVRQAGFSAAVHSGVLFGPMRILYKISTRLARRLAPMLEPVDDAICSIPATTRFAGHLVTIATR